MKKGRNKRQIVLVVCSLLVGCLVLLFHGSYDQSRQAERDRALIDALKFPDDPGKNFKVPDPNIVLTLLKQGANPDARQEAIAPPIAALWQDPSIGGPMLHDWYDLYFRHPRQNTALLIAVDQDNYGEAEDTANALATVLLAHGAAVNAQGAHGHTALMTASFSGHDKAVQTLLKAGAHVNLRDDNGETALMNAAQFKGSVTTMRLLLDAGANVNLRDKTGTTALGYANERIRMKLETPPNFINLLKRAGGTL